MPRHGTPEDAQNDRNDRFSWPIYDDLIGKFPDAPTSGHQKGRGSINFCNEWLWAYVRKGQIALSGPAPNRQRSQEPLSLIPCNKPLSAIIRGAFHARPPAWAFAVSTGSGFGSCWTVANFPPTVARTGMGDRTSIRGPGEGRVLYVFDFSESRSYISGRRYRSTV